MSKTKGKSSPIVGVVGSGSFGTAIVKMLLENSKKVVKPLAMYIE